MSYTHYLGIDLGTSNSALACASGDTSAVQLLSVTQVLGPNSIGEQKVLPSALYIPQEGEFEKKSFVLPWEKKDGDCVVGQFAREHGAKVPDRLVTSAKSWLCNVHVDHHSAILPWGSAITQGKLSPLEASRRYLEHLRSVYTAQGNAIADTFTVLTVPASFDEAARSLTHEAAKMAGFNDVTLLEEPQAAFYAWLDKAGKDWRKQVNPGDIVLICDVGGGTSDFSLIAISEKDGNLELERIAVGEHILLGGDNVDLALAFILRQQIEADGNSVDDWQFQSLRHFARIAKETLFERKDLEEVPVAVPSRGSSLFGGTLSTRLTRKTLHAVVLDGFIPKTAVTDLPKKKVSTGLQEFGLSYAGEAALSKHLAAFLTRSLENVLSNTALAERIGASRGGRSFIAPNAVLFNGGFFKAEPARERVLELLTSWAKDVVIKELQGGDYDLAVAYGAAVYARIKQTDKGVRIKAGAARSYYLGLESSAMAIPGFTPPVKALCIVPQGMEEGSEQVLDQKEFGLVLGTEVNFRFFSSAVRAGDTVGTVLADAVKELEESATLETTMTPLDGLKAGDTVPVKLHAAVTELGMLELCLQHTRSVHKWKLEFSVRTE